MKIKLFAFYFFLYVLLYFFTLNFNYIEGDDAYTILYHALGRDNDFQPHYSAYHSMFDTLLSLFSTNNEVFLRYFAIGISFVFGLFSLILIAYLGVLKTADKSKSAFLVILLLPFIIPEILFSSLIVNSTLLSITFLLLAHIFLIKYIKSKSYSYVILSVIIFGLGVSFRWSNGFYLFVLFGDFILNEDFKSKPLILIERVKKSFFIFTFYIVSVLAFIQISGYTIIDIYNIYTSGSAYIEGRETSYLSLAANAFSFLTPSIIILLLLSVYYTIKEHSYRNVVWLFISILPYFILGFYPSYKYMINIIVILLILAIQGYSVIKGKPLKYVVIFTIFIVWLVGFQINNNSAWGPGFEFKIKNTNSSENTSFNPDRSVKISTIKPVIGAGIAMPTPEGPRPLYGYGEVFISKWKTYVSNYNNERQEAVNYALKNKIRILQDVNHSYIYSKLLEMEFNTKYAHDRKVNDVLERTFGNGVDSVTVNVFRDKKEMFNTDLMNSFLQENNSVVVYSSYSNIIAKLKTDYKDRFVQKGVFWGVFMH